jgi:hypothetical protein
MASGLKHLMAASALALGLTVAGAASAQGTRPRAEAPKANLNDAIRSGGPASTADIEVAKRGRFGLNLKVDEPLERERRLRDVEAGAAFRITPSVRVGGSVRLDDKSKSERLVPSERGARVRLETKFQF